MELTLEHKTTNKMVDCPNSLTFTEIEIEEFIGDLDIALHPFADYEVSRRAESASVPVLGRQSPFPSANRFLSLPPG